MDLAVVVDCDHADDGNGLGIAREKHAAHCHPGRVTRASVSRLQP